MSRKNYRAVAEIIKRHLDAEMEGQSGEAARQAIASVARSLADHFKAENYNFRYDKFYEACGLNEWGTTE